MIRSSLLASALMLAGAVASAAPVTVRDLVQFRRIEPGLALSPDGRHVAYVVREPDVGRNVNDFVLHVMPLSRAATPRELIRTRSYVENATEPEAVEFQWLDDSSGLLVLHRPVPEPGPVISRVELSGGRQEIVSRAGPREPEAERDRLSQPGGVVITPADDFIDIEQEEGRYRELRLPHADGRDDYHDRNEQVEVGVSQAPDRAPEIYLRRRGGAVRTLTNLNPQLRQQQLGRTELLEWREGANSYWGYIVYPVSFVAGRRYPCAILAKSWTRDGFIYESQDTYRAGNFPAQALAGADILVFMLARGDIPHGNQDTPEATRTLEGYYGARRQLAARGLIDPARCGLMGFSHTGWQVDFVVSHPLEDPPWAAAISVDHYVRDYGWIAYLARERETLFEAGKLSEEQRERLRTVDDARDLFLRRSPAWNAASIRTPLLEQAHYAVEPLADLAAALWARGKPVEVVWMPGAPHTLTRPLDRELSMQRAVDWFRFWLQGHERASVPEDPQRYERWRRLRDRHRQNESWIAQGKDPNEEWWRQVRGKTP